MFKFFKKQQPTKAERLETLINKQTNFCVNAVEMHPTLIAWAPDKSRAIFESFVFHNWFSFYMITRHICASLPATASTNEIGSIKDDISNRIISSARSRGIPLLKQKYSINTDNYCDKNFSKYASMSFRDYNNSVNSHQCPDWASASIKLAGDSEIPGLADFSNLEETGARIATLQKEVLAIFMVEKLIKADVYDYLNL